MRNCILVTGGAGFIGSNFVLEWMRHGVGSLVNLDRLTYAGNLRNLSAVASDSRYCFVQADINDGGTLRYLLARHSPRAIVHFAAETHVDRSILGPGEFIRTNVDGTFTLLEEALAYWRQLTPEDRGDFRFLQVSTDEVYGSLRPEDAGFRETTAYAPNSPYSASKAAADHLVRAYHHTYGLPTLTTNCSNNYGPYQFPEKLIPLMILNALDGKQLPVYGKGENVRDWLYVLDHCSAIRRVLAAGRPGETYNIGGNSERQNLHVVEYICELLDEFKPNGKGSYREQIAFVKDRPGHDLRYAIDNSKLKSELGWVPQESFESGMRKTVEWYLENPEWIESVQSGEYRRWMSEQYDLQQR